MEQPGTRQGRSKGKGKSVEATRLCGETAYFRDEPERLLPRRDFHGCPREVKKAKPASATIIGNRPIKMLGRANIQLLHSRQQQQRGLAVRPMKYNNGTGASREEQAAEIFVDFFLSDKTAEGHFRGPHECREATWILADTVQDGGGDQDYLTLYAHDEVSGDEEDQTSGRVRQDSDGSWRYANWDLPGGEV